MRVNCNVSALIANKNLSSSQTSLNKALERLSSGLKINSAKDDAAGLAIANRMHTQIKSLDQASKNSSDGISVVQTAESALSETESILQRMNELAVQAANATNSLSDRQAIQQEIDQLAQEVDRISTSTEFNTMPLLDGTLGRRCYTDTDGVSTFYVSSAVKDGDYSLQITSDATQASATVTLAAGAATAEGTIEINGASMEIKVGDTQADIMSKFTTLCNTANLNYDSATGTITTYEYGISQSIDYTISPSLANMFSVSNVQSGTDATATLGAGFNSSATMTSDGRYITVKDLGGFEMTVEIEPDLLANSGQQSLDVTQKITSIGTMTVQLGANEGQVLEVDIPAVNIHTLGLDNLNVCTQAGAGDVISRVGEAINKVSGVRATLGAYQNRLDDVVSHLAEYKENITSAVSGIEDSDMAEEMTEYTQQSVITQVATSVLGQANERPQSVLQLLQ